MKVLKGKKEKSKVPEKTAQEIENEKFRDACLLLAASKDGQTFFRGLFNGICNVLGTERFNPIDGAYQEGIKSVYLANVRPFIRKSQYIHEIEVLDVTSKEDYTKALKAVAAKDSGERFLQYMVNACGTFRSASVVTNESYDTHATEYNRGRKNVYLSDIRPHIVDCPNFNTIERPEV